MSNNARVTPLKFPIVCPVEAIDMSVDDIKRSCLTEHGDTITPCLDNIRQCDKVTRSSSSVQQDVTHVTSVIDEGGDITIMGQSSTFPDVIETLQQKTGVRPVVISSDTTLPVMTRTHVTSDSLQVTKKRQLLNEAICRTCDKPKVTTEDHCEQVTKKTLATHQVTEQIGDTRRLSLATFHETDVLVVAPALEPQPLSPLPLSPHHPRKLQGFPPDPQSPLFSFSSVYIPISHPYPVSHTDLSTSQPPNSLMSETPMSKSFSGIPCLSQHVVTHPRFPESCWEVHRDCTTLHPNTAPHTAAFAAQVLLASCRS